MGKKRLYRKKVFGAKAVFYRIRRRSLSGDNLSSRSGLRWHSCRREYGGFFVEIMSELEDGSAEDLCWLSLFNSHIFTEPV